MLERWQRLAQPRLDGICERRLGIQNRGEKASDACDVASEVFDLDDCEEDGMSASAQRSVVAGPVTSCATAVYRTRCVTCNLVSVVCRRCGSNLESNCVAPTLRRDRRERWHESTDSGVDSDVTSPESTNRPLVQRPQHPGKHLQQKQTQTQESEAHEDKSSWSVSLSEMFRNRLGLADCGSPTGSEAGDDARSDVEDDVAVGRNVWLDSDFILLHY